MEDKTEPTPAAVCASTPKKRPVSALLIACIALVVALLTTAEFELHYREMGKLTDSLAFFQHQTQQQEILTQQLITKLVTKTQQQQQVLAQLQQSHVNDKKAIAIAEAGDLVQRAQYNLQFTQNVPAAIAALQLADKKMAEWDGASALSVRQQLADNIAALQAVPSVDLAGALTQLQALQQQIPQLPVVQPVAENLPTTNADNTVKQTLWQRTLQNSWNALSKLIVIQRHDQPIQPILPTQQQAYLQQNLQLLLQQAQWALLHEQPTIYQASLAQAKNWTQRYFSKDAAITQSVLKSISELQAINVQPQLPDISATVQAIEKLR